MFVDYKDSTIGISYSDKEYVVSYALKNHPTKFHIAFSCKNNIMKMFIDGEEVRSVTNPLTNKNYDLYLGRPYPSNTWTIDGSIYGVKISNVARYTENFTLPTKPYSSINIDITNEDNDKIDFIVSKLGQEVINKTEILVNNEVVQTYNEIGDLTYNIDESIMNYGNNDIKIRVTFDDVYTEEVQTVYFKEVTLEDFNPIINLPSNANIQDIVNRISLINSTNKAIKNNLKNLLESKGFVVGENPRLSNMVKLVNELSNDNSTEITEYINRINELENESEENRQKLIEIIQESNTELSGTESIDTLLKLIDVSKISASQIAQISCGLLHTGILLTDGSVWMCGYGGRIGLDSTTNVNKFTRVTNDVRKLYCLGNNSYIIKNDGTLWACGGNECGQLGLGDTTTRYTFTQVKTNVSDIKELYGNNSFVFMLKNDGTLWACGKNNYGQLGLGDTTQRNVFTQVKTNVSDIKEISCGTYSSFMIKNDGTLWACGYGGTYLLGTGTASNQYTFTHVLSDVAQVGCGSELHTVALKNDGTLWACGKNDQGQLGLGTTTPLYLSFTKVNTNVNNDIKKILCYGVFESGTAYSSTIIIKNDGTLWACGANASGQLGLNDHTNRNIFTKVSNINNIKQISASGLHVFILTEDGNLLCTGYNHYGQLGLGHNSVIKVFTNVDTSNMYDKDGKLQEFSNIITLGKDNLATVLNDENVELNGDESLIDLVTLTDEKFTEMNNEKTEYTNMLREMLISKNIEGIENETNIVNLINKIELLNTVQTTTISYLYDSGDEFTNVTGGWVVGYGSDDTGTQISLTAEKLSTQLYIYSVRTASGTSQIKTGYFRTTRKIDLTNYKTLEFDMEACANNSGNSGVYIYKDEPPFSGNAEIITPVKEYYVLRISTPVIESNATIDISDLTGEYYICVRHVGCSFNAFTKECNFVKLNSMRLIP